MTNWLNGLKKLFQGGRGQRRPIRKQPALQPRRRDLWVERLEDRLTPSTLSLTAGTLKYLATSSETNNLTVSYSSATHKYTFADTGATITSTISGETGAPGNTVTVPDTGVTTISIDLSANTHNDKANIDSINAATTVTTGGGMNTVNVSSNAPTNTGNLAGIAAALTVTSTNGGYDSLVMSNFSATTGDSNVVVGSSTITGFAPSTITYNTASLGSFNLLRLIGSNSPTLAEKFTVNDPNASTFQLDSNAGPDTAIIEGTNSGTTNNINMGAGAATVTVSSDGSATGNLDGILGTLNINEGSGSGKTLNLIDYGSAIGRTATVSGTAVSGFAPATINYKAVGGTFSNITLSGSNTVSDSFTVTANSPALNLEANGGGDAFILENNATVKSIAGGSGTDTLTYGSGYTNTVSVTLASSTASGFNSASATGITGGFTGIDALNGTGSSTLTNGEGAPVTWTLGSPNTYSDGHTLDFSGFTTLAGGGTDTLAGVGSATVTGDSTGFSGTTTGPAVSFSGMTTLDGTGTLTNGQGVAVTWTLGSPDTYYDGSHTLDFSGFTTLAGGGTDTLAGVGSATVTGDSTGFSGTTTGPAVSFSGMTTLDGTGTLTNGEGVAVTWTLGSPDTYYDGSHTLDFSGFTTLAGGGTDTLAGVTNATVSGSSAGGFSGTATSPSVAFSGMTTLDGSGTLTGENTTNTWTIVGPSGNTYYDGSYNLSFSGFTSVIGGTGADTFNVTGDLGSIDGGGTTPGPDTYNVASATVTGPGTHHGVQGTDGFGNSFNDIDVLVTASTVTGSGDWAYNAPGFLGQWELNGVAIGNPATLQGVGPNQNLFDVLGDATTNIDAGGTDAGGSPVITISNGDTLTGTIDGQDGTATLNYNGGGWTGDAVAWTSAVNVTLTGSSADGYAGTATGIIGSFNGVDAVTGSTSTTSTLTNGEGVPVTWTLGSPDTYYDGTATLDFSGFTTLAGGGTDTLAGIGSATVTGDSTGFSGTTTGPAVSFSGMTTLDGTSTLTNGEGVAVTWTLGSPDTYYDGTATLDFSGFTTLAGGGTDTLAGVGSATVTGDSSGFSGTTTGPAVSFSGMTTLDGTGTLTNGEGVAVTWTLGSPDTYYDGTATLDFSGFTTLAGGGTDTLAGVGSATVSGDSSGFSGTTTGPAVSFSGMTTLDGTGTLTNGQGVAVTWTLGSPDTYYDGSHTLDFSGFTTLAGGGTDTLAGIGSATVSGDSSGFSGTTTGPAVSFSGMTTLDGTGTLTNGQGVAVTWTLGSPDTYYDGTATLDFSGFTTLAGGGTDTLAGIGSATVSGDSSGFSGTTTGPAVAFSGMTTLNGTGSGSLTNGEGVAVTWTVDASPTYYDGTATLNFSGFTTLNGGGTDTLAGIGSATVSGDSSGFSGTTTGPAVAFSGMTTLNGTGSGSLTNGEGVAVTWTVDASPTYYDGTATLNFSGFTTLNGGSVGDTFYVTVVSALAPLTVNGVGGTNTYNIGYTGSQNPATDGLLSGVQGSVTINGASGDILNVSDAADTNAIALTMTAADIQSSSAGDIIYNGPSTINITAGDPTDGTNAIDVESAVSGTTLVLTTTGNSDVQFAQVGQGFDSAFTGVNIILAGTSSDTLTVNDQANTADTIYAVSDSGVTSTNASITINGQFGQEVVFGGSGANTFNVTPSTVGNGTIISVDGGSSGTSTLNYMAQTNPPETPVNDNVSSIYDSLGNYEPVYYYDFLVENIV